MEFDIPKVRHRELTLNDAEDRYQWCLGGK